MQRKKIPLWVLIASGIIASICSLIMFVSFISATISPSTTATPTQDVGAIYTQAYITLIADYTQNAPTATFTAIPATETTTPTNIPLPTATLEPTQPPPPPTTFTAVPYIPPPPPTSPPAASGCSCSGDTFNCGDFSTHSQAQACYNSCLPGDIHRLDQDNDGIACEGLQ